MQTTLTKQPRHIKTGVIGESVAARYLTEHDFKILERNHRQKWGEIDIIATKDQKIHFVEVKTVSYETKRHLEWAVTHGTWRPEDNVHAAKVKRLSNTIETWLSHKKLVNEWQIDIIAVRIVPRETFATINHLNNVVIG